MPEQHPVRIGADEVRTDESMVVTSPYDGHEVARVPTCGPEHVERAVAAAKAAMAEPLPPWRRAEILDAAASSVADHRDELATLIAEEAAKPIRTARTEAERAVLTFQAAAIEARTLTGDVVPLDGAKPGDGKLAFTLRVPRGVVAAISPFNFPLNLVAHKLAPAIAAGCAVVLKPASQTPMSAIRLHELLMDECGLPPGWINVVTGAGGSVGDPLVEHPDVAVITFTGSPDVGWAIAAKGARKKVGLELGNNAPIIIDASGDWEAAAAKISVAGFSHAGQSCISTQRIYVHASLVDRFTDALTEKVRALVVGDPMDEATDVSALISAKETDRVQAWIDEARDQGATVAAGGERHDRLLEPTVLQGITPDMEVSRNEVFGPVVGIAAFEDLGEALALANDTRYGLQAAIFTAELDGALRAAHELDFGGVLVNEVPTFRSDQMPYGGVRDSGNTREGPHYAVREMTQERLVVIQR
ncbi:MAG TPA: aldehyde dehydrogenase family protein [Aquihabitans sp.]|jgi:acyl-CoA reductase-like NAD-dependent aldehyde dehydrogenase|nr:aldehyde dehydrogenase family protein [Aquihabitans sp.]